jgi:signal transduction histidine kinase
MNLNFTIYSQILVFFGVLTLVFAIHLYNKGIGLVKWFALLMGFNALWTLGVAFEFASTSVKMGYFFAKIEYIGIVLLPVFWLLFTLDFAHKSDWYKSITNLIFILITPVITVVMVWTNEYHHFYFADVVIAESSLPFMVLKYYPTIVYWIVSAILYFMVGTGLYIFIKASKDKNRISRTNRTIIILFAIFPWLANFFYQLGLPTSGNIEITPFVFVITSLIILIGIYRYKLFNLLPFAQEKIFELMDEGFIVLDPKSQIIDFNSAITKYLTIENTQKIIGTPIKQVLSGYPTILEALEAENNSTFELQLQEKNSYIQVSIIPINDYNFNTKTLIIKFQDVTHLRAKMIRTEIQAKQLSKLNQQKDRIFSVIANDLRGPVINISEVLNLLEQGMISNQEFKTLSPVLRRDIIYTTEMLENLLHWSRSQLKGFGIKKEPIILRNLVAEEITYFKPIAELKNITFINDVFPNELVYADNIMFQIVVRNLLSNALKFSKDNSTIEISAAFQKNKMIRLCIRDYGIGMTNKTLENIRNNNDTGIAGTLPNEKNRACLGLVICKEFLAKNDGFLTIESVINEGTSVYAWVKAI